jgi:hypothetical protein
MKKRCYSAAIPSVAREIRTGPKTITNWPYWCCNHNTIALWVDYQHDEATLGTIPWCSKIPSDHLIHLIPRLHILVHSGAASSSGSPAFRLTQLKRYQLYKVSILIWTNFVSYMYLEYTHEIYERSRLHNLSCLGSWHDINSTPHRCLRKSRETLMWTLLDTMQGVPT